MKRTSRKKWMLLAALLLTAAAAAYSVIVVRSHKAPDTSSPAHVSAGTLRMAAWLRQKREEEKRDAATPAEDNGSNLWLVNRPESIPAIQEAIAEATKISAHINLRYVLARELLWCGRNQETIQTLDEIRRLIEQALPQLGPDQAAKLMSTLRSMTAICFLRMGEQDNCVCGHNADSCIFPIHGGGVHSKQEGSRAAIEVLSECLTEDPRDLGSRWLLNLAYMTLGEHPAKVPPQWLIPQSVFDSEYDIGRFHDVAAERGVDVFGLAGGCALEDFDGDGHLDIMASGWSLNEQLKYFRNRGDGTFEDRTEQAGLLGEVGGLNLSHADYNNDGHPDVIILRGGWLADHGAYPPSLLRNNGNGTFDDVTQEAGLLAYHPGQVGVWADFDNDGWVDLFLGHENDQKVDHPSLLYHNNRDGTFTECGETCGVSRLGFVKGAAWGDYDNDGLPDLYVSRMGTTNILFHNEGRGSTPPGAASSGSFSWKFRDVTAAAGVAEPVFSFSSWFFDYDNDGWLDLFVAGFSKSGAPEVAAQYLGQPNSGQTPKLYRNKHDGTFADVTHEVRLDRVLLVMGANFGDIDNDGFLDIYLGTGAPALSTLMPNRMFRNAGGKLFQDVTTSGGFGHLQKGHGIAFGDIDGDGDQDIYAVLGGWYTADGFKNSLFLNPGHGNHWITLRLEGVRTNRSAIGARIKLTLPDGAGKREVYSTVSTGGSFGSSSLQQEIGLGAAESIDSIEITWPVTGKTQVLRNVKADQVLKVREE